MSSFYLTLFVSLVLAAGGVLCFVFLVGQRDHDHADRLSLLPLEDDVLTPLPPLAPPSPVPAPAASATAPADVVPSARPPSQVRPTDTRPPGGSNDVR